MGLGNSSYALGDLDQAAKAFRQASSIKPDQGIAYNNLALVLFEMGRQSEARSAAGKAVSCGGPLVEEFKKTLAEVTGETAP